MEQITTILRKPAKPDEPDTPAVGENESLATNIDNFEEIPEFIFRKLPPVLKDLMCVFQTRQDKEIVLLSCLAVFSGCIPKIYGIYAGKEYSLNIYVAIIGQAGSGKSIAGWARYIVVLIEKSYIERGKMLFFPADTSFAALLSALSRNNGTGILFAFEIDTMTQNFGKEWGNINTLLRQAFQQERGKAAQSDPPWPVIFDHPSADLN